MSHDETLIFSMSDAGVAAEHPRLPTPSLFAAPATEQRFNTVRAPLAPIASWAVGDARFQFGSSFIGPDIAEDLSSLAALCGALEAKHGKRPLATVFGHADPVGNETFNKALSGRRAAAIYGMLTRKTEIWEDIFSQEGRFSSPLKADEWGSGALEILLGDLGYAHSGGSGPGADGDVDESYDPVVAFQRDHELVDDGQVGPATRAKLFHEYMDKHARDREGNPFQLEATDFLSRGDDDSGKADFQGCSEFNPLLIFSEERHAELSQSEAQFERDAANAPNRRVVVFLFPAETRVSTNSWPCPLAKEGDGACRKRLWSDASGRTRPGPEERRFEDSKGTLACRFYHRLAHQSPCEKVEPGIRLRLRLLDIYNEPMSGAPCRVTIDGFSQTLESDGFGGLDVRVADGHQRVLVEWGRYDEIDYYDFPFWLEPPGEYEYSRELFLDYDVVEGEPEQMKRRLHNLGYPVDCTLPLPDQRHAVGAFQCHYPSQSGAESPHGELDDGTKGAIVEVHGG